MFVCSSAWSPFQQCGVAIVRMSNPEIARKLAVILRRMWCDGTAFAYRAPEAAQ